MKAETWWGVYNFGVLVAVVRLRRDAIENAKSRMGNAWKAETDWKSIYQIRKVIVQEQDK